MIKRVNFLIVEAGSLYFIQFIGRDFNNEPCKDFRFFKGAMQDSNTNTSTVETHYFSPYPRTDMGKHFQPDEAQEI